LEPTPSSPTDTLLQLLGSKARLQAVSTFAALALAEAFADGPRTIDSLASERRVEPGTLRALLRMTAGLGYLHSPAPDSYALTPAGQLLRQDQLGALAAFVGSREQWDPWSALREAAGGGPVAFSRRFGRDLYAHLAADAEAAARYNRAIDAYTAHEANALSEHYDFGDCRSLVDVGGGCGSLLRALLQRWTRLRGTLVDLPHVVAAAAPPLTAEFGARLQYWGGDFFTDLPIGHDTYLCKHVLHNWDDARAVALLRGCAAAMAAGGRVLAVEYALAPDDRSDLAATMDLEMLVLNGGRVRRRPELRRLFQAAGLRVGRVLPLGSGNWLFEGWRRDEQPAASPAPA
jgi:hypothetical protein